jgi:mannose-6-phosphate isomerase-like protein (cupin superfamily)
MKRTTNRFRRATLPAKPDYISPGGIAQIRELLKFPAGEITHVVVPAGKVSLPSRVFPSSEWFFVVSGSGLLWDGATGGVVPLVPNRSIRIAPATPFQYRASDEEDLEIVLAALPQWQKESHGVLGDGTDGTGHWKASAVPETIDDRGEIASADLLGTASWDPDDNDPDRCYVAPDRSKIWTLGEEEAGGLALCTLPPGGISAPVFHRDIEEIWYVLGGGGVLSRRRRDGEPAQDPLAVGTCVDIPKGVTFQFRAGNAGLRMLLLTMPKWPGDDAATPDPAHQTWDLAAPG